MAPLRFSRLWSPSNSDRFVGVWRALPGDCDSIDFEPKLEPRLDERLPMAPYHGEARAVILQNGRWNGKSEAKT